MKRFLAGLLWIAATVASAQTTWLDVNGDPLPFADDAALLEFLRTATVVDERDIGAGVNRSKKLTLERDGLRAHAIFRVVDRHEEKLRVGDRYYLEFADSYRFECAAYELSTMLGLDMIPPVVLRTIGGREGSIQIWLEDVIESKGSEFRPPHPTAWTQQVWRMQLFDNLVFNPDRNLGNMLVDSRYRLWLIDHTRAFQSVYKLLDDRVVRVDRDVFERLVAISNEELGRALRPYLKGTQMGALFRRRELLIDYVEALVEERGANAVFY